MIELVTDPLFISRHFSPLILRTKIAFEFRVKINLHAILSRLLLKPANLYFKFKLRDSDLETTKTHIIVKFYGGERVMRFK